MSTPLRLKVDSVPLEVVTACGMEDSRPKSLGAVTFAGVPLVAQFSFGGAFLGFTPQAVKALAAPLSEDERSSEGLKAAIEGSSPDLVPVVLLCRRISEDE